MTCIATFHDRQFTGHHSVDTKYKIPVPLISQYPQYPNIPILPS